MAKSDGRVIIDVDANLDKFNTKIAALSKVAVAGLGAMATAAGVAIGASIKMGMEFESAFAGVRKTVNATEEEFKSLEKSILEMSTKMPMAAAGLASITESAGQLGIKNENLIEFTRVMADLGVATNLSGEAAATTLARLANITGMSQGDFDRLGSSIVALGNNLATTEAEIADMALAIAGAGSQVGMSEAQILALSGALSSVGIEAQAGGTAISTLIIDMKKATNEGGSSLNEFAKAANMTAKEFKEAFEKDAAGAIQSFIAGLSTAEQRGSNAFQLLEDVGIVESRMTRAMLGLSGATEVLNGAFETSNKAWQENTALVNEAAQRYETTESKMQMLQNSLTLTGITAFEKFKKPFKEALDVGIKGLADLNKELSSGDLGNKVDKIAEGFTDMAAVVLDTGIKALPKLIDGLAWVADNGDKVASALAGIGAGHTAYKAAKGIDNMIQGIKTTTLGTELLTGKVTLLSAAQKGLMALMTGPMGIGLAVGAIAALTVGYVMLRDKVDETAKRMKESRKVLLDVKDAQEQMTAAAAENYQGSLREIGAAEKYTKQLEAMRDESGNIIGSKEEIIAKVDQLNSALGDSIYWYDAEKGQIMDNKGAVDNLILSTQALINVKKGQAWLDANMELYTQALKDQKTLTDQNTANTKIYFDIIATDAGKAGAAMLELDKAYKNGSISLTEFNKQKNELSEVEGAIGAYQELAGVIGLLGANDEQIAKNETLIGTYGKMVEAVQKIDTDKISAITSGLTVENLDGINGLVKSLNDVKTASEELATLNEMKGMGLTIPESVYNDTVAKIENLKGIVTDLSGIDYESSFGAMAPEAFNAYVVGLETAAANEQARVNEAFTTSLAGVEEVSIMFSETAANSGATGFSTTFGNELGRTLPSKGTEALGLLYSSMNESIRSYYPPEIKIKIVPEISNEFQRYGVSLGGATYDGTSSMSSIIPDFKNDLVEMARRSVSKLSSRVGTFVLGVNEGEPVTKNQNVNISQVNNFNTPVNRPSELSRQLENTTKELAKAM